MATHKHGKQLAVLGKNTLLLESVTGTDVVQTSFGKVVLLPNELSSFKLLHNVGEKPSIKLLGYQFPGKFKPYIAQDTTASFMAARSNLWCLNGMGAGKTASAIWAVDFLKKHNVYSRVLVLAPLSTLESIWEAELLGVIPNAQYAIANKSKAKLIKRIERGGLHFLIANHDKMMHWYDIIKRYKPELIILDEASMFRSDTSGRYKALESIVTNYGANLWALTATPCPKSPLDVWPLCRLISPQLISANKYTFRAQTMYKVHTFKWVKRRGADAKLDEVMQPCIRISREDSVDIPPVTYESRVVAFSVLQKKALDDLEQQAFFNQEGDCVDPVNGGVMLSKVLQVCSGLVKAESGNIIDLKPAPRLKELVDVIENNTGKFLVMSYFRATHLYIQAHLKKNGLNTDIVRGGMSSQARRDILSRFSKKDGGLDGLILQPKAAGFGLNLTAANLVVWYSAMGDAEIYLQANERNRRSGQTSPCTVVHLVSGSEERDVYTCLKDKISFQDLLIQIKEKYTKH